MADHAQPPGKRKGYSKKKMPKHPPELPAEALRLQLYGPADANSLAGCPVPLVEHGGHTQQQEQQQQHHQQQQQQQEQEQHKGQDDSEQQDDLGSAAVLYTIQLEAWSQMQQVVAWFSSSILPLNPGARLAFPACLPKEQRADVHTCVSKKHAKVCASVSEGFGEHRHVALVAKGAVQPAARWLPSELCDHALALWLLWKDHHRQQQQQQHPLEPPVEQQSLIQQQQQQQHPRQGQPQEVPCTALLQQLAVDGDKNGQAAGADGTSSAAPGTKADRSIAEPVPLPPRVTKPAVASMMQPAASPPTSLALASVRVYSRDEVAQMMAAGQLTDELSALWEGPLGAAQRMARQLCLAAAAGDDDELQELLCDEQAASVLSAAVPDLSAGGALPLHLAASGAQAGALALLLAAGAPVEARDGRGFTALQVAQRSEACDCEALLMQAGAINTLQDSWHGLEHS